MVLEVRLNNEYPSRKRNNNEQAGVCINDGYPSHERDTNEQLVIFMCASRAPLISVSNS